MLLALWNEVSGEKPMQPCFQLFTRYHYHADIDSLLQVQRIHLRELVV